MLRGTYRIVLPLSVPLPSNGLYLVTMFSSLIAFPSSQQIGLFLKLDVCLHDIHKWASNPARLLAGDSDLESLVLNTL